MAAKKYQVELTANECQRLEQRLRRGAHGARKLLRARILLNAALGMSDEEIAQEVDSGVATIERTRKRFASSRLGALEELPRPGRKRCLEVHGEARLIAEACSPAPGGREHWTLQLLADRAVELHLAESCSDDTVQRLLKKTRSSRG
jgi:transposase